MPARDFLANFTFDPATFNYEQFRDRLAAEISTDEDLSNAKITEVTEARDALVTSERDLKVKLFDATMMKTGTPVTPNDSPARDSAGPAPAVPESDIFEKVQ